MARTISLHYSTFVLNAFFNIARMSDNAGVDLWNLKTPSGKSLQKAFEALKPYITKEKEWEGPQIKDFEFEDGYTLLMDAAKNFNCQDCKEDIRKMAGDKSQGLLLNLLY